MKYALVDQFDNIIRVANFQSPPPPFNQKPWRWIPIVATNNVTVDNNAEIRLDSTYVVSGNTVTENEQKRTMTVPESDARKNTSVEKVFAPETIALATVCFELTNAVRNLNSQPSVTVNQFKNYLKTLL